MERVSDEWIDAFFDDDKYGMIMCGVFAKNVILCMKELQARRKAENEHGHTDNSASEKDGAGATQEREKAIDKFWMKIELNYCANEPCSKCPASDGDKCGHWEGTCGRSLRKKYESIAGANVLPGNDAPEGNTALPIPCTKGFEEWSIKDYFQKINEELDELKEAVGSPLIATPRELYSVTWSDFSDRAIEERCKKIAEEAADTITAITSMLEAMGIGEQQRQAAQKLVNEHNRQRGRC